MRTATENLTVLRLEYTSSNRTYLCTTDENKKQVVEKIARKELP